MKRGMGVGRAGGGCPGEGEKGRPAMSFVQITDKSILNALIMCLSSHRPVPAFQRRKCLTFRGGFLSTFGVKLVVYKSHRSGSSLRTLYAPTLRAQEKSSSLSSIEL